MIRDEDVIKKDTSKYMKSHERVLYSLALVFGIVLIVVGIVFLAIGGNLLIFGIVLIVVGVLEVIGVWLLLWTEGVKQNKHSGEK